MCHESCISFGASNLKENEITGKRIIEVGSRDVNGSLRYYIQKFGPKEYIGIDIEEGKGVDIICNSDNIVKIFGKESFDLVICTELLEHVKNWKETISNIKNVCKRGGTILVTTRSYGFPLHEYPTDHWRYEIEDISNIFSDCKIEKLENDLQMPGVFAKIKKEDNFIEKDLIGYDLFEINANRRILLEDEQLKVLVGIPTYNGANRLDWLLHSIFLKTDKDIGYQIVICDDSGKTEHQEKVISIVDKYRPYIPIDLIVNDKNIGVSRSWNRLVNSYNSRYVILINDDIIVDKNWLKYMVYFLDNNPNAGAVFYDFIKIKETDIPRLFSNNNLSNIPNVSNIDSEQLKLITIKSINILKSNRNGTNKDYSPLRCLHYAGSFFCFSREKYNMVGGFDENYFANFEETDFCTALTSYGFINYILRNPKSWHIYSATFKSAPEFEYWKIHEKSKQYYNKKWKYPTIYIGMIPFQKVKWKYNDIEYEDILKDMFSGDMINDNV